ncbi:30S ribosomal protein S6 [Cesiribacter sp. SM1]|uniref:30S ribosomal protein S6 n=1 Tax=Cesiribacter sp. SM1 TaxID=2861196 RepID=UPI001CD26316
MMYKQYETVFILNPVLSETQVKDAVDKFRAVLTDNGAEIVNEEQWGLRKLAYPIQHKNTGFYVLFQFNAPTTVVSTLETEYRRDEAILRFLTVALDKHGVEFNERRRKGDFNKKEPKEAQA